MTITPQFVFLVLGIASLVLGAVLVAVSLTYYFRNDIKGVRDDLSGKARQGDTGNRRRRARGARRTQQSRAVVSSVSGAEGIPVRDVPGAVVQPMEDDLDTVLDTKLRKVPSGYADVSSDGHDVNDYMPTVVTSMGDYHRDDMPERNLNETDIPTEVEKGEEDVPTQVEQPAGRRAPSFVVTKSILAIHSDEIITAG